MTERKSFKIFVCSFLVKKRFWDITPLKKYFTIEAKLQLQAIGACISLRVRQLQCFQDTMEVCFFFNCFRMWIFWSLQILDEKVMRCPILITQLHNPCLMITSFSVSHSMLVLLLTLDAFWQILISCSLFLGHVNCYSFPELSEWES